MHRIRSAFSIALLIVASCSETTTSSPILRAVKGTTLSVAPQRSCGSCPYGPTTFTRSQGAPVTTRIRLTGDPNGDYVIRIDDNGSQGADASVALDGVTLLAPLANGETGPRDVMRNVTISAASDLQVRLTGKPGSTLTITLYGGAKILDRTGGIVRSGDGRLQVAIPPNGLTTDNVLLTITPVVPPSWSDPAGATVGSPYDVELVGGSLALPATVTFAPPDADRNGLIDGTSVPLRYGALLTFEPSVNGWTEPLQWFDSTTGLLTVEATHFSLLWYVGLSIWSGLPRQLLWSVDATSPKSLLTATDLASEVDLAFTAWQAQTVQAGLTFRQALTGETPNIVVGFADVGPIASDGAGTWGKTSYGKSPRRINLNENLGNAWSWQLRSFLTDLVIHEVGHAIGLNHPTLRGTEPPIMAPFLDFTANLDLHAGDVAQVRARYNIGAAATRRFERLCLGSQPPVVVSVGVCGSVLIQTVNPAGGGTNVSVWIRGEQGSLSLNDANTSAAVVGLQLGAPNWGSLVGPLTTSTEGAVAFFGARTLGSLFHVQSNGALLAISGGGRGGAVGCSIGGLPTQYGVPYLLIQHCESQGLSGWVRLDFKTSGTWDVSQLYALQVGLQWVDAAANVNGGGGCNAPAFSSGPGTCLLAASP